MGRGLALTQRKGEQAGLQRAIHCANCSHLDAKPRLREAGRCPGHRPAQDPCTPAMGPELAQPPRSSPFIVKAFCETLMDKWSLKTQEVSICTGEKSRQTVSDNVVLSVDLQGGGHLCRV